MPNKARRGELKLPLPAGQPYDPLDRVLLDPHAQVQQSPRLPFDAFKRTGSATARVRYFAENGLAFTFRVRGGLRKGELHWQPLTNWRTLQTLHNPRYADTYSEPNQPAALRTVYETIGTS